MSENPYRQDNPFSEDREFDDALKRADEERASRTVPSREEQIHALEERLIKLEKVAMYAQELLYPKGSEPMCLTQQARNENVRRERLSQALNELNKDWGRR